MKRKYDFEKSFRICFLAAVIVFTMIACIGCSREPASESSAEQSSACIENTETASEEPTDAKKELFVFRPIVDSPFYEQAYSKEHMQSFRNMMNALLNYETEFDIADGVEWWQVDEFASYLFPAYSKLVQEVTQTDSKGTITYQNDREITKKLLRSFAEKVEWWINSCTESDEPDMVKALKIYLKISEEISYDYEAADDNSFIDVSPYRAIMDKEGICQSFAPAYAYLLMQIGIDACPVGGLTEDLTMAHEWTMLKLSYRWFYADVTFENGNEDNTLWYFGMTAQRRYEEGNFTIDSMNIGECNRIWGKDIDVSDERFAGLRDIYNVTDITYDNDYVIVEGTDFNNMPVSVQISY